MYYIINRRKGDKLLINIFSPRIQNSLQIELFVGQPNELDVFSSSTGFELFILNSTDFLNKLNFINLSPGFEYNIAIHKTVIEQIPKPYSSCEIDDSNIQTFESKYVKIFRSLNTTYRQADCVDL